MTLAVMTRSTLGHTGRRLAADGTTHLIFGAIVVAALTRICAAFEPGHFELLIYVSGIAWTIAFLGFAFSYGPALIQPRLAKT
ncbi:MAG: NnrS family protein, partial [Terriglobia bacterium]